MRVLVVGGGIAGCAVTLAAHRAGFDAEVYEAQPDGAADHGAFLTLATNGMAALAQLGAAESVAAAGFPLTTLRLTDHTGAEVATRPLDGHADELTTFRCLRRSELCRVLRTEVRHRGVPVRHGARLVSVESDDTGVLAGFADGSTARGDVLVGADGLHSVVRTAIDPGAPPPRYAGQRVFYGCTTRATPPTAAGRIDMVRGSGSAFGYCVSPTGETFWYCRVTAPPLTDADLAGGGPARWRELLLPLLRPDRTPSADIVAATGEALMVTNARDLPSVRHWYGGRALVVGDAAHAASPATGQGAALALEDAVVLGKALRDTATVDAAFVAYERMRRPRVDGNTAASAQLSAGRPAERPQQSADELAAQLDWHTPLPG